MKPIPTRSKLSLLLLTVSLMVAAFLISPALPQTRERTIKPSRAEADVKIAEVIKTDVDLVTVDALVLQKNSARVIGGDGVEKSRGKLVVKARKSYVAPKS